ncbi:uncharacterized protein LOC107641265 [Arachis ipaensis]|uniref:uncharacterized protein LOC107641265 n=1 Tax=Arachis ipaensis TaxID=130454 RepID=UPI0007AFAA21|nr:uncharacterized protein LOC107641265 [Arachis ipaensis]
MLKKQSTSTLLCSVQFSTPHTSDTSSRVIAGRGYKVVGGLWFLVLHEKLHLWSSDREVFFDKRTVRFVRCAVFRMSYFSVKVYHHGSFGLEGGLLKYLGGETTVIDYCNEDEWSLIEVYDIVSRQGYLKKDIAAMWYKSLGGSTEEGLRMLRTDKDAMDMANIGVREDMVELYVVHKPSDIHEEVQDVHMLGSTETTMQEQACGSNGPGLIVAFEAHSAREVERNSGPNVEEKNVGEKNGKDESDEEEEGSDGSEDEDYTPKGGVDDSKDSAAEVVFGDSDDDKEGAEGLVDVDIRVGDTFEPGTTETQTDAAKESRSGYDRGKEKIPAGLGDEEEGYESEDFLDVPIVGDDEDANNVAKRYPLHKQLKDMSEYKWEIGTLYVSREEFKDCATAYAVHTGRGLRFDKVDLRRVKVICVEGCNWFAYCGKMKNEQTWQLTSCHNKHSYSRELKIGIMHAKWLSKVFLNKIAENPKIKLSTLMKKAYSKWNVELTKSKAARVKQFALDELQGTYIEQYRRLYDYCHELLRSNPGSTVKLQVERPPEFASERPKPGVDLRLKFQRLYVCLDACKKSFMVCRPIICLDGCFIKTPYGGQLLTAIGWDPNDQMLPIAYAVVEVETKDTWTWFLTNLCDDFGYDKIRGCTFMSDQQKGLVPTFDELIPGVDHRFCVRHLYSNFRKRFPGLQLKLMMWNAAKATYLQERERRMAEIQSLDNGAYNHLMEIPTKYWCRHKFGTWSNCDTLVNNMCEVFNSVIVDAREKPIVSMLEDIRVYIMRRWADNRDRIIEYPREVLPRIRIKVEKQADASGKWVSTYAGRDKYEVTSIHGGKEKFVVDLKNHECSCRKF